MLNNRVDKTPPQSDVLGKLILLSCIMIYWKDIVQEVFDTTLNRFIIVTVLT